MRRLFFLLIIFSSTYLFAQNTSNHGDKFEALGNMLPTPNEYRTASGAPAQNIGNKNVIMTLHAILMKTNWY